MIRKYNKTDFNNSKNGTIIKTFQMYRKDSLEELNDDIKYFESMNCNFSAKLVRGAYYNSEYREGHLFNDKNKTDNNYNLGIIKCYEAKNDNNIIASHNKLSLKLAINLNKDRKFIVANLMGMNEEFMNRVDSNKAIYIPYGPYLKMIPYLTRRLYENMDQIKYI